MPDVRSARLENTMIEEIKWPGQAIKSAVYSKRKNAFEKTDLWLYRLPGMVVDKTFIIQIQRHFVRRYLGIIVVNSVYGVGWKSVHSY